MFILISKQKMSIYCFSNPSMPGIYKIGFTERNVEERLAEANHCTWVIELFQIEFFVLVDNPREKEQTLHKLLENSKNIIRVNPKREFFQGKLEDIKLYFTLMNNNNLNQKLPKTFICNQTNVSSLLSTKIREVVNIQEHQNKYTSDIGTDIATFFGTNKTTQIAKYTTSTTSEPELNQKLIKEPEVEKLVVSNEIQFKVFSPKTDRFQVTQDGIEYIITTIDNAVYLKIEKYQVGFWDPDSKTIVLEEEESEEEESEEEESEEEEGDNDNISLSPCYDSKESDKEWKDENLTFCNTIVN